MKTIYFDKIIYAFADHMTPTFTVGPPERWSSR